MEHLPKTLASFLWYFVKPYKKWVFTVLITSLLWSIQQSLAPYIFKLIIELSSGQRQRIAIARAMLKNAPILILDEATSALDSVSEQYIYQALHKLMQEKTVIVIAHRLSTLSQMDRLLVFDKGQIVEDGSHDVLLRKQGLYAKLWHMQAGGFLPE